MKIFISWSGVASQQIAQELREWLPLVFPVLKPFITTSDIEKGARWASEIAKELEESNYGLVCLTENNLLSQWLAFEAGALSKHLPGKVATILFGVGHADVRQPLSMFQGTLFEEADFRKLLTDLNNATPEESRRTEAHIDRIFESFWPDLKNRIKLILDNASSAAKAPPQAADLETLILDLQAMLRQQNAILSNPDKFLEPVIRVLQRPSRAAEISAARAAALAKGLRRSPIELSSTLRALLKEEQTPPNNPNDGDGDK